MNIWSSNTASLANSHPFCARLFQAIALPKLDHLSEKWQVWTRPWHILSSFRSLSWRSFTWASLYGMNNLFFFLSSWAYDEVITQNISLITLTVKSSLDETTVCPQGGRELDQIYHKAQPPRKVSTHSTALTR